MSFILDALRKSEHSRQRATGPGLAEAPVAVPKPKSNVWATAAVVLLVVNLLALGVLLLRRAAQDDDATADAAGPAGVTAQPTLSAPAASAPPLPPAPPVPPAKAAAARGPSGMATAAPGRNPLVDELGDAGAAEFPGSDPGSPPGATAAAAVPDGPPAVSRLAPPIKRGSVVYAPVPEAADLPYTPPPGPPQQEPAAVTPSTPRTAPAPAAGESLPGADEMVARGVPALHLDLHVYSNQPQQRFVFVNSRKYREGDTLQEGPVIERITPDGAVMNFRGSRFKLSND